MAIAEPARAENWAIGARFMCIEIHLASWRGNITETVCLELSCMN